MMVDYQWFITHQDEYMKLQTKLTGMLIAKQALVLNKEVIDLANLTSTQRGRTC